ncbi:hypothetical protein NADFUDRAFT_66510 [Nadsonia fulvescens var. elongata DSM 6958]|uniref:Uncharacterized protein n=1 Tax=Nadsonia fulvescens var. elongata DSM 6958 TaxID=857566 RepID=A0A1E3PJ10_9ASCO|nr:hypothetical protein NADFUDRAFT_66510 [Nadsonia fulvescens var. elongata DSM 6958]
MSDNRKIPNSPNRERSPPPGSHYERSQYRGRRPYSDRENREGRYGNYDHYEGARSARGHYNSSSSYDNGGSYHNSTKRVREPEYDSRDNRWESRSPRGSYNDSSSGNNYYQSRSGDGRYSQHSNPARLSHHESRTPGSRPRSKSPGQNNTARPGSGTERSEFANNDNKTDTRSGYGCTSSPRPPTHPRGYTDMNDEPVRLPTGPRSQSQSYGSRSGYGNDNSRTYASHGHGGASVGTGSPIPGQRSSSNLNDTPTADDRKNYRDDGNRNVPTGPRMDYRFDRGGGGSRGGRGPYGSTYVGSNSPYDSFSERSQSQYTYNDNYRTPSPREGYKSSGNYRYSTDQSSSRPIPSSITSNSVKNGHPFVGHNQSSTGKPTPARRPDVKHMEADERKVQTETSIERSSRPAAVAQSSSFRQLQKLSDELMNIQSRLEITENKTLTNMQNAKELERELLRDQLRVELTEQCLEKFQG